MNVIYEIFDPITTKRYIGSKVDYKGNYLGSSSASELIEIKRTRPETLEFNIIKNNVTREDLLKEEGLYQRKVDAINSPMYWNKVYADTVFGGMCMDDEIKDKISKTKKERFKSGAIVNGMLNKTHTKESRLLMSQNHADVSGSNNPMYGKPAHINMTVDERANWASNIAKGNTGKKRTLEHRKNYSNAASQRIWLVNKDGKITHTIDKKDYRLDNKEWQRGRKWKNKLLK